MSVEKPRIRSMKGHWLRSPERLWICSTEHTVPGFGETPQGAFFDWSVQRLRFSDLEAFSRLAAWVKRVCTKGPMVRV